MPLMLANAPEADAQLKTKTFTVTPCRILDTRLAVPPGPIPAGTSRFVRVTGNIAAENQGGASDCQIPEPATCFVLCSPGTVAIYANVIAVGANGAGHVSVYPYFGYSGGSTINFSPGQTVANAVLTRICFTAKFVLCASQLVVAMGPAAAHIVIDVTGYAYVFDNLH